MPQKSCDLTPLDFLGLCEKVYKNDPQSIPELKNQIVRVMSEIEPQLCQIVIENLIKHPLFFCSNVH